MQGTMMEAPLTLPSLLERASALFGRREVVSRRSDRSMHRYTYTDLRRRAGALAEALQRAGLAPGDRVATLMWNDFVHLEAYFGVPLAGGVLHTLNLRLPPAQLAWIVNIRSRIDELRGTIATLTDRLADGSDIGFPLEWYKLSRQHELELNKATLSYEQERLRFLAYLNGGSAAAFVTLGGTIWKDNAGPNRWSYAALAIWVAGLVAAWVAWTCAHNAQSLYTQAYLKRRQAEECRRRDQDSAPPAMRRGYGLKSFDTPSGLDLIASRARAVAGKRMKSAWCVAWVSIFAFAFGIFASIKSIAQGALKGTPLDKEQWTAIFDLQQKLLAERDRHIEQLEQDRAWSSGESAASGDLPMCHQGPEQPPVRSSIAGQE